MRTPQRCRLPRRLAAVFYDGMILVALFFFATIPVVLLHGGAVEGSPLFTLYLLLVAFAFYGWFWTHGGQTLGMRAWRTRLVRHDGAPVRWRDAAVRFMGALLSWTVLGAGFWWTLFDREGLAWHDRLSGTELRLTDRGGRLLDDSEG